MQFPILLLSRAGYITFLAQFFEKVYIPMAVRNEIFDKEDETSKQISKLIEGKFIQIKYVNNSDLVRILNFELGAGESEAIVLSRELKADYVLLDDMKARISARSFEIKVIGTLGLTRTMLKKKAIKESPEEIYKKLKSADFWITKELFLKVLKESESR